MTTPIAEAPAVADIDLPVLLEELAALPDSDLSEALARILPGDADRLEVAAFNSSI